MSAHGPTMRCRRLAKTLAPERERWALAETPPHA